MLHFLSVLRVRAVGGNRTRLAGLGSRSPTNGRPPQGRSSCELTAVPIREATKLPWPSCLRLVLPLGIEPRPHRLKGECSTFELRKRVLR